MHSPPLIHRYSDAPREIKEWSAARESKASQAQRKLEEDNFIRLPETKKDKKQVRLDLCSWEADNMTLTLDYSTAG